jgi:hypothetical protein
MDLKEKLSKIFESGYSIAFQNEVRRKDDEWYSRIVWRHIQLPGGSVISKCEWFGFDNIETCVDDCLEYIKNI